MRECQFCDGPLDPNENGLAYRIMLGGFDPAFAAHDVCAEAARGMQRDLSLHRLYCHLPNCFWQSKRWDPWQPRKVGDPIARADRPSTSSELWNEAWQR